MLGQPDEHVRVLVGPVAPRIRCIRFATPGYRHPSAPCALRDQQPSRPRACHDRYIVYGPIHPGGHVDRRLEGHLGAALPVLAMLEVEQRRLIEVLESALSEPAAESAARDLIDAYLNDPYLSR